jgi:hypothetical protein
MLEHVRAKPTRDGRHRRTLMPSTARFSASVHAALAGVGLLTSYPTDECGGVHTGRSRIDAGGRNGKDFRIESMCVDAESTDESKTRRPRSAPPCLCALAKSIVSARACCCWSVSMDPADSGVVGSLSAS